VNTHLWHVTLQLMTTESSFVQLIAALMSGSLLTPDMASKNNARHGIGLFDVTITQCHDIWHRFLMPCLGSNSCQTSYLQSIAQLRQTSLQVYSCTSVAGCAIPIFCSLQTLYTSFLYDFLNMYKFLRHK